MAHACTRRALLQWSCSLSLLGLLPIDLAAAGPAQTPDRADLDRFTSDRIVDALCASLCADDGGPLARLCVPDLRDLALRWHCEFRKACRRLGTLHRLTARHAAWTPGAGGLQCGVPIDHDWYPHHGTCLVRRSRRLQFVLRSHDHLVRQLALDGDGPQRCSGSSRLPA